MVEAARRYAVKELMPLLGMDPTHHRAYAKPLGYAGDYRVIQLFFAEELEGDTLFGRFLHYVAQNYTLARTVRNREKHLRDHLRSCARAGRIQRVASLGSGPALEVQRLLREEEGFEQPLELFLVDQDEVALEHSHEALMRILLEERRGRLPVNVQCIHFSVRQLLEPRGEQELHFARKVLRDLDLVYSTGLFDYLPQPVARKLVNRSYEMLRPGGRLYIGNLERVPDTSWVMEYVLAWRLVYRTPASMRDLARELDPAPVALEVIRDSTGHCLFLDLTRPA
jgi:extracellular factor (EF) 3-hydroxypalmitic acid methyl ester biosynthesis protein